MIPKLSDVIASLVSEHPSQEGTVTMMSVSNVVASAYRLNGSRPVAYLDETYNVDDRWARFYVMTAVVVQADQRADVRDALVDRAGSGYWHTSEALRARDGQQRTLALLDYLGHPDGSELCVLAHARTVEDDDADGEQARARCLTSLLHHLTSTPSPDEPVELFVLERRRDRRQANRDAQTKTDAIRSGRISRQARLLQVSPGEEQLLWLPDLVCSAYRRKITAQDSALFERIARICRVLP